MHWGLYYTRKLFSPVIPSILTYINGLASDSQSLIQSEEVRLNRIFILTHSRIFVLPSVTPAETLPHRHASPRLTLSTSLYISALGWLRQEKNHTFQPSLGYLERTSQQNQSRSSKMAQWVRVGCQACRPNPHGQRGEPSSEGCS